MTRRKRATVTDIIGKEVKHWKPGEVITIEAGTGAGKSYFIKDTLYKKAKREGTKILFLLNRTRLSEQFQHEIERDNKTDVITILLYQKVEDVLSKKSVVFNDSYQYIVCDEFHYFLTESKFNGNTEDSFNMIIADSTKTKIFMSATADAMIQYFHYKGIPHHNYHVPYDYRHIKELIFYRSDKVLEKFLHKVPDNHKVIHFNRSAKNAFELHKLFSDSLFVCSASGTSKEKKYLDKAKISQMLANEKFEEKFLFTTSTLDNGINLRDNAIKYIVADIQDVDVLIQCLGRKRIKDNREKVTVIIKDITNKMLYRKKRSCEDTLGPAQFLKQHGSIEFIAKYPKHNSTIIYDRLDRDKTGYVKVVNEMRYFREMYDKQFYEQLLLKENGYMNYLKEKLQQENYTVLDDTYEKATLSDYLDSMVGKKLYKDEQDEFVKKINLRDGRNRLQRGCRLINEYFVDNNLHYSLKDKLKDNKRKLENGTANPNYSKTYWLLAKYDAK